MDPDETPGIGDFGGTASGLLALFGIVDNEIFALGEAGIGDFGGEVRLGDFGGDAGTSCGELAAGEVGRYCGDWGPIETGDQAGVRGPE